MAHNSTNTLEVQFACGRLAAVFLPLNNRLTTEEIQLIIGKYLAIAGQNFELISGIADSLADQVANYQVANPDAVGLDGFTKWLQTQRTTDKADKVEKDKAAQANKLAESLDKLAAVFVDLERIGLTKKEIAICKLTICGDLTVPGFDKSDILPLIEGGSKPPPKATVPVSEPTVAPAVPPPAPEPLQSAPFLPPPPFPEAGTAPSSDLLPPEPAPDAATPPPPPPEAGDMPTPNAPPDGPMPDAATPPPPPPPPQ